MINELILRRGLMGTRNGIDWATIGHGMLDYTTPFSVPAEALPYFTSMFVGKYLFIERANLQNIDFTGQINIPERICQSCGLTSVTFPDTITRIGNYSFYGNLQLTEVISLATTPPTMQNNALQGNTALQSIYVPDASVSTYQGTSGWSSYASIIKPISQRPT